MLKIFKKDSLNLKIWLYLILFSCSILIFVWIFQIVFLNLYYEQAKLREIEGIVTSLKTSYNDSNFINTLDTLTYNNKMCAEIIVDDKIIYSSGSNNRNCASIVIMEKYKSRFLKSNKEEQSYKIINPMYDDKILIKAIKLNENSYMYINTALEPLDGTVTILKDQFISVTIIVLLLSFVIAMVISRKLARPIEKITKKSKLLASGNNEVRFNTDTGIEEINELSNALNYVSTEINKTNELRRDLMANVSHDLKTPLTMIKAYSEMIRDISYKDKEKMTNNLNTIIEETDRLNLLVEDILTLTKLESKTIVLEKTKINLNKLVSDILSRYEIFEDYKFNFNSDNEFIINADKKRLEQVFYNLINNAINYTGNDKKININLKDKGKFIQIEIIDTGKGIKTEELDKIWDKYYTTTKNHKRNKAGTGIGLSIVKNILELHNFEYGVKTSNKGTNFYFLIKKLNK